MSYNYIDLTGKNFGRLTVIERAPDKNGRTAFLCRCTCGNIVVVNAGALRAGRTHSCGCLAREQLIARNMKHGCSHTRLHNIWSSMLERCNTDSPRYKAWHGRGIKVCEEWVTDFSAFKEWAENNGYTDKLTIDRIDVDKGYCPENCRWVTKAAQNWNKTNTRYFEYKGERKCLSEWASITGIKITALRSRIYRLKWDIAKALETPVQKQVHYKSYT